MKVALVHDDLTTYGEAERVLRSLHRLYPQAPLYTTQVDWSGLGQAAAEFRDWDIRLGWWARLPGAIARSHWAIQRWLPEFWESLDLSTYDLVISSSRHCFSHAIRTAAQTLHVCYCHTPARPLWEPAMGRAQGRDRRLREYDFYCAQQRVDRFVTNSVRVARRIRKFYRRTAEVIPPPVAIRGEGRAGSDYYLYLGPVEPENRVDLLVQACAQLERPLWVVGQGRDRDRLQRLAPTTTRWLDEVAATDLPDLFAGARAVVCPQPDTDFATAPVAGMGHGVPAIACAQSGLEEVILEFRTGLLFAEPTVASLSETLQKFESLRFSPSACIQRAEEFAESVFISRLEWFIAQAWDDHQANGPSV